MSSWIFKLFITILFLILPLFFFNSLVATEKKAELFHLDIDGDKEFDALTDGLLILRSMFGLTGTNLVSGAISSNAVYSTPGEIEDRIIALGMKIDIDNNGDLDALTDGLLILRYLFGLTGETLTNNVISSNAVRADSDDIESYMNGLLILNVTPVFLSDSLFSADENQLDVGLVVVDDREGDTLSFEVSGSDLTINQQGYLKFISEPDFEVRNNYEARVGVSDGTMTVYQDITVNVLDVNEGPVFFSDAVFSANENQILVGTVISRDPEGDEISYTVSGSNLEINSLGNLKFLEPPNYENKSQYEAVITASDGQIQSNQSIEISVLDENEAPIFQSSPIFTVDENILDIGQIIATDPEGDAIEYSISEGSIEIRSDGLLLFKSPPDYESESSYNATVTAFEGSFSASQNISVLINNVNERPSIVSNSQFYADENQLSIGAIDALDPENDSLTFTITGDEINVDPTGLLTFINSPNYELKSLYSATVSVSDGSLNETQELTIDVNDINEGPIFSSSPNFTIDENTTIIGVAMATDPEGDSVGYTVSNTNIEIRSDGILSFINAPDFEQKSSYSETISATDGEISTDQPVTIYVNNLNDNAPVFSSGSTFSADENQKIIGIIQARDADNDAIQYTISGPDSILMAIDESSGALAFLDAPDYETRASYSLEINANDGGFTTTDTIVISINNLNDNPPIFSSSSSFTIDENILNIGTVSASDADNDQLSYSISGEDASLINIDSETGELIFKIAPDYETKSSYSLIIAVSDGLNTTTSNVSILINNKNDNNPVFSSSSSFSVEENQLSVGSIKAEDADGDEVTFSIYGEDASHFQIDSNLGLLTFSSVPDHEQNSTFSIIVAADDGVNSTNQSLTINLIDICEFEILNQTLDSSKIEDWHNNWMVNDDNHISNSRFFFEFEVSSSDDACESDSSGKTYTFNLEGSDKSKFELSASTGTEGNKYHVLTNNKYDYEIPNDSDGNNIYEVELQVGLAGETISEDLNLAITNIAEFGEITSFSYDEASTAFTFDFVTNHDLPIGTKQLQFAIRGPSFPTTSTSLQSTVDYIEGTETYTISIDALQALTEAEVADKTVYGGYYEVYEIQALTETGSEIDYVRTYRIKGPRHLYYERDDGNNFVKVESIEGNIVTSDDLSHTVLTGNLKLSNFNYRPATEEAIEDFGGEPSQGTDARVTFSWHLDSGYRGLSDGWHTPSQGATYGNDLYHSQDPLDYMTTWDSEGNVSVKIYGNKRMRSGDHKYGISLGARSDRGYYRTYIYWSELVRMGLASDPISFTNTSGEPEDLYGPRLTSVTQPTVLSCEYRFASRARVEFASMMTFEDNSIDRLGNGTFKSEGLLRLRQLDEYGVQADSILLRGTPNSEGSVTLNRTDSNILIASDGPDSQFILTPGELKIEDASGISSKYTDQYYDTQAGRYNDIADLNLEDIDLREHCNFNFGDNAPIFSSPSVYSVNENQSLIGTLIASDLDGDKLEYFLYSMNDYSIYSLGDSTGELRFMNLPDYEVQNSYEVVVGATDGFNYTYQTLTINIIDLDD